MLLNLLRGANIVQIISYLFSTAFIVFCTLPIHEYAHALVATKLGDQTARLSGRLTINPMAHLDPIGSIMIFLVGFGYAKPVPVNPRNFKNPKKGMALTALAGPVSNLIMAFVFLLLKNSVLAFSNASVLISAISYFLYFAAYINISLAVFNLIPIPPLDGSRIFSAILPDKYYFKMMQNERIIMIVIFVLLFTGILSTPLSYLTGFIYSALNFITALPFGGLLK